MTFSFNMPPSKARETVSDWMIDGEVVVYPDWIKIFKKKLKNPTLLEVTSLYPLPPGGPD